jgi:peptidoglycan/xylan/chitin deacetylase (PgdA/CDA1 family)
MKIFLTLDYELFLGSNTGSVEKCLIEPMTKLCAVADKYGAKFTIFVDATYLLALKNHLDYPSLRIDYQQIKAHLLYLKNSGHSLQLHVHPHWLYAHYNGHLWVNTPHHYRLSQLSEEEATRIIIQSKQLMEEIIQQDVHAFRAGGFSIQPFEPYSKLFGDLGLKVDSSVLHGCYYNSDNQQYDYRNSPAKDKYSFNEDVCKEDTRGAFVEYPIATHPISFLFWWKLSFIKLLKSRKHVNMGDGVSVETTTQSILTRLTKSQLGFACMDGYKSSLLYEMKKQQEKRFGPAANFVVLGHPKLTTPYSLKVLDEFINMCVDKNKFDVL